jgi:branched-chain amino acid aminotransferase
MLQVWIDDELVPADRAMVSVYDRGFRTGEGVFETLRAYSDHVFRLAAHLERARAGARELGFDPGETRRLERAVRTTATANLDALGGQDSALRLTISAGRIDPESPIPGRPVGPATVAVTSHRLAPAPTHATAATVPLARELPHVKALSYLVAMTARRQARQLGADEALLTDGEGRVLEGAGSNVFAVIRGQLVTPPADAGLLAGVTRAVVLELARSEGIEVAERRFGTAELAAADEAFLTSTLRELVPLRALDGQPIGPEGAGPVTRRLADAYRDEVARERAAGDA